MRGNLLKRVLVLGISAAMICGTCCPALAAGSAAASEETYAAGEDVSGETYAAEEDVSGETEQSAGSSAVLTNDTDTVSVSEASGTEQNDAQAAAAASSETTLETDADGYYLIGSADDMEAFAEMVLSDASINGRLTADITLDESFIPIGAGEQGSAPTVFYTGIFDGSRNDTENYTVTLSLDSGSYLALFAGLGSGGTIQNLNIAGTVSGEQYCAGAVAYAAGGTIQNVKSSAAVETSESSGYAAGILAYNDTDSAYVYACENSGTISGASYVGGIVGYLKVDTRYYDSTVSGCRNTGTVTGSGTGIGGVLGYSYYSAYVYGCVNTGAVSSTSSLVSPYVGGIVGGLYCAHFSSVNYGGEIAYCFNTGSLSAGSTTKTNCGGILGYHYAKGLTIDRCYNSAEIDNDYGYYGGIAGYINSSGNYITNCYNTSDIGSSGIKCAGGIAYRLEYSTTVTGCYNTGTITAATYAGAIVAYSSSSSSASENMTNCYYLSGSADNASGNSTISEAVSVDSDTLKGYALTLGDAYKTDTSSINSGYPILTYQDLEVDDVKELMEDLDEASSSYADDLGFAYAAYYSLSEEEQEEVFSATADTLTVTKSVSETDTNGYALSSDLTSSISGKTYSFALYKADDTDGTNAAAVAGVSYILTDASGTQTECVTGTDGSFTLKDGESATFGGEYTPALGTAIDMNTAGCFSVREIDTDENFETFWKQAASSSSAAEANTAGRSSAYQPVDGGTDNNETVTFNCTNTYLQDVVSVTKTVSDEYVSSVLYDELNAESYTFTLTQTVNGTAAAAANISYTLFEGDTVISSGNLTDEDGSFTLTGGQTAKFIGVDLDSAVTYSVAESALTGSWSSDWTAVSSVSDAVIGADGSSVSLTGTAAAADTVDFTCTNTYLADTITVTNIIADTTTGGDALSDAMLGYLNLKSYTFTLYQSETAVSGERYDVYEGSTLISTGNTTDEDGSFTLKGGQTAVFEKFDMTGDVSYLVSADDLDSAIWSTGWSAVSSAFSDTVDSNTASSGSVSLTGTAAVADTIDFTCTNTYAYDSAQIYTLDDLAVFSEAVSDGYYPDADVMADIDATGTTEDGDSLEPIGGSLGSTNSSVSSAMKFYTGTFDGNGHTITLSMVQDTSKTTYDTALFCGLDEGGVIENLTVDGTVSGGSRTGGVAAVVRGGTIQNVTNKAAVTSTAGAYAGGIAGYSTSSSTQIIDCANEGTVTGAGSSGLGSGGILGYGKAEISGCSNTAAVVSAGKYNGGIAGYLSDGSLADNVNSGTVSGSSYTGGIVGYNGADSAADCINYGDVNADGFYAGGIIGLQMGDSVSNCINYGNVTGTSSETGGIAGSSSGSLTSCFNHGSVTGAYSVGGIAGACSCAVEYCGNDGAITATGSSSYYSGGLIGSVSSTVTINSCYNKGDVSGSTRNGGVIGAISANASVTNCYNTGSVSSSSGYAGGIAAYMLYTSEMKNCYNAGELSGTADTNYLGGVVSRISSAVASANISNNYALDNVDLAAAYNNTYITDDMMMLVSSDALKTYASSSTDEEGNEAASVLGSAYKEDPESVLINDGYPILLWEYHIYETSWSWSDDYSSATLIYACVDGDDTHSIAAEVETVVLTEATCTTEGLANRTATATYNGETYTASVNETVIAATGHDYGEPEWIWSDDCSSATAVFTCANDAEHVAEVTVQTTSKSTPASCTDTGESVYTASVTYNGTEYTEEKSVTVAATGHSYEEVVTEPTCTEGGYTTYTCSVCGDTYTGDETAALGHDYAAAWTWAEDYSAASVTLTCSRGDDEQTYEASVSSETVEATADAEGSVSYTAVYTDADGNVYTDTVTEAVAYVPADDASDSTDDASDSTDDTSGSADDTSGSADDASGSTGGSSGSTGGSSGSSGSSGSGSVKNAAKSSYTVPASAVSASKASLTGATEAEVTATLQMLTDDGDLADSSYSLLQAKAAKVKKSSMKVTWKKVSGAVTYVVYANQCGKGRKLTKLKSTSSTSLNVKKIAGKKLKSGKYYKFLVVALDKNGQVIATSKTIHAAAKGGKVTNVKSLSVCKGKKKVRSVSLKKGGSVKIKTKSTLQEKSKKLKNHRKVKYESSNTKIATVTGSGRIKAKAKGTCYIYAYAQNGVCSRIKVTVR